MSALEGVLFRRGDAGYEDARIGAVANRRVAVRYPAAIVRARSVDDVVHALELARAEERRVTVRSGGHSWSGAHLRDDVVLLDLGALNRFEIDQASMTATAEPGLLGSELAAQLHASDMFFPVGHCLGPGLGGYLLQGGFGWNSRAVGPACMSVTAIDVVTAAGELVRADEHHNADLFWAARGAGPLFFGVATRFHLTLQRRPAACMFSAYVYPLELLDEVMRWMQAVGPHVPRTMELTAVMRRNLFGRQEPAVRVTAPVFADSEEQARDDLKLLESCPVIGRALPTRAPRYASTDVIRLVAATEEMSITDRRYAADNMWTHASIDDLLPGLRRIADTLPASPSHFMWMNWGEPSPSRPDMCFSSEDFTYLGVYGVSDDPGDDSANVRWVTERMQEMEHLSSGIQLADENLANRPARFMAPDRLAKLHEIRVRRDPEGIFYSPMHDLR